MSSYGMCPYGLCILHSTRFWYKRRGFAVINIDIISYWVVKNMILRFRPCWAYPVGWSNCSAYPVGWSNCWVYPVGWSIHGGRVEIEEGQEGSIEPCEKPCQSRNYRSGGPR